MDNAERFADRISDLTKKISSGLPIKPRHEMHLLAKAMVNVASGKPPDEGWTGFASSAKINDMTALEALGDAVFTFAQMRSLPAGRRDETRMSDPVVEASSVLDTEALNKALRKSLSAGLDHSRRVAYEALVEMACLTCEAIRHDFGMDRAVDERKQMVGVESGPNIAAFRP